MSHPEIFVLIIVVAIVLRFAFWTIGRRHPVGNRARSMRWRIRFRRRPGPGYASALELSLRWACWRAVLGGKRARPGLPLWARLCLPTTDCAVRLGRAQWFRRAWGRMEDQTLILAPPRTGKSGFAADRMLSHPGPCLATTTRTDLYELTARGRAARGPIEVFNPQRVGNLPSTFAWNIVGGCEDPETAMRRAGALVGAVEQNTGDMPFWRSKASMALAAFLHAAALLDRDMITVFQWCNRHGDGEAVEALATDPRASRALLSTLGEIQAPGKTADSIRVTMSETLTWVAIPVVASAVSPGAGRGFDVAEFIAQCGTLYMIAQDASDNAAVSPLFRAFAVEIHWEAGMLGSRSAAARLDPPLLMLLDEVTQICPVPLPAWLSDSAGKGILIAAACHSTDQLATRWGDAGAATVWATCGTKVFLPGIDDPGTLESVSVLCGDITVAADVDGQRRRERLRVVPPELLRTLPDWRALVMRTNLSPCVVKIRPAWKRRDVKTSRRQPVPALRPVSLVVPAMRAPGELADWPPPKPAGNGGGSLPRPPRLSGAGVNGDNRS